MSAEVQQINLFRPDKRELAAAQSARLLLGFSGLVLVAVTTLAGLGELYLSGVREDQAALARQLDAQRAQIADMDATLPSRTVDPFLAAELERLGGIRSDLLTSLSAMKQRARAQKPFSEVFVGLARNRVDGLWLNRVGLAAGGTEMWLRGQTLEPALVPKLLQTLSGEPAFAGRTFRKVTFERQGRDPDAVVDFELRSAHAGEAGDAG